MSHNFYFGFRNRVIALVISIIVVFGLGTFLMFYSFKFNDEYKLKYDEKSKTDYEICLLPNEIYKDKCLKSSKTYNSLLTDKVLLKYSYESVFSRETNREFYYHVIVYNKIYDINDKNKVLYENDDVLINKTSVSKNGNKISFDINQEIDYKKYNDIVNKYKKNYFSDVKAGLDVIVYLDNAIEERKIGTLYIPLSEKTFNVKTNSVNNKDKELKIEDNQFDSEGSIYIVIGGLCIVLSLILDIRLVRLVKTTFTKKSKYEIELAKLLKEYDKYIVNAKDGYSYDDSKDIVKVESLKELVDASNIISKPIMYSKVNNVKSEFILEDTDKVYKYVLKESTYEE